MEAAKFYTGLEVAIDRFWRRIPAEHRKRKLYAISAQIERMENRYWINDRLRLLGGDSWLKQARLCQFYGDLTHLWDLAAGLCADHQIERIIWAHNLNRNDLTAEMKERINENMHKRRADLFGPIIFEACQTLQGRAKEFAWEIEAWSRPPKLDPQDLIELLREKHGLQWGSAMSRIIFNSRPPRYKLSAGLAEAIWDRLQAGLIRPKTVKERNDAAADLVRAAAYYWQQTNPMSATALFRALYNPNLAPDERTAELLKAAHLTFKTLPKTDRTIRNYLKA